MAGELPMGHVLRTVKFALRVHVAGVANAAAPNFAFRCSATRAASALFPL